MAHTCPRRCPQSHQALSPTNQSGCINQSHLKRVRVSSGCAVGIKVDDATVMPTSTSLDEVREEVGVCVAGEAARDGI